MQSTQIEEVSIFKKLPTMSIRDKHHPSLVLNLQLCSVSKFSGFPISGIFIKSYQYQNVVFKY